MRSSDDLIAAVRARLDETERIAKAARMGFFTAEVLAAVAAYSDVRHVLVRDPAAVLRRVAADRRILAEHQPIDWGGELYCDTCGDSPQVYWPCPTVRALADGLGIDLEETTDES